MCAAGMALLVTEFINVYSAAKPKQPNNCPLIKERGLFALFPQFIVERPIERDYVGVDTPTLRIYLPVVVNWRSNFLYGMTAAAAAICPSEKCFFFFCILGILPQLGAYSLQVNKISVFTGKTLQFTLDVPLMILCLYFLLLFRLPLLVVSHAFSSQIVYKYVLVLPVFGTWRYVMQGHLFFCLVIICYLD